MENIIQLKNLNRSAGSSKPNLYAYMAQEIPSFGGECDMWVAYHEELANRCRQ